MLMSTQGIFLLVKKTKESESVLIEDTKDNLLGFTTESLALEALTKRLYRHLRENYPNYTEDQLLGLIDFDGKSCKVKGTNEIWKIKKLTTKMIL